MKNVIAVILGCGVSVFIALLFMPHTSEVSSLPVISEITTKAFQVGVFINEEKALEEANKLEARVIKENDKYYLYVSILSDNATIEKMMNYLDSKKIKYFQKIISVPSDFKSTLIQYEEMMKKTTSTIAFMELNKRLMDIYEASYEN